MNRMSIKPYIHGFALLEVMIAVVVFVLGMLGVAHLLARTSNSVADANQRVHATWILQELANRIYINPEAMTRVGGVTTNGYLTALTAGINCAAPPPARCADFFDTSKRAAQACTSAQLIRFDLWEASCSYRLGGATDIFYNSRDFLGNTGGLSINMPAANADRSTRMMLRLNWTSHANTTLGATAIPMSVNMPVVVRLPSP